MGGRLAKVALAVGAAAGIGLAFPGVAHAACVGTAETAGVCITVNPTGGTLYEDCIYVVSSTCMPVTVPGPTIDDCHGWIGDNLAFC